MLTGTMPESWTMSALGSVSGSTGMIRPRRSALTLRCNSMGSIHMYDRDATIGFNTWEYTVLIAVRSRLAAEKCTRTLESG